MVTKIARRGSNKCMMKLNLRGCEGFEKNFAGGCVLFKRRRRYCRIVDSRLDLERWQLEAFLYPRFGRWMFYISEESSMKKMSDPSLNTGIGHTRSHSSSSCPGSTR